ncbi:unannotated protein [freshwater metagenome]|uniref:Unannotated protein n=1 Tax=freshwater metagenome TaxID=449393 RepID=A0A6J6PGG8_9ZZZZ
MLQAGRLSSAELTAACLDRSRARDGATTAWIRVYPEYAAQLAKAADKRLAGARRGGPAAPLLSGVPLALKDLYAAKGLPVTASSRVLSGNIAPGDSTAWARLKAAGMVLLGHAETDEFAVGVGTPQSGNPWDPARSPGGSSGGSGAVLGARLAPAALGSDTGGSLRLPATACGITALKPTFGLVSAHGVIPLVWGRDHAGPMARSAADVSLLLSYLAGHDQHDPATLSAPVVPRSAYPTMASKSRKPYAGMRFGVVRADVDGLPAATAEIFARFLTEVRELGGTLVDVALPANPTGQGGTTMLAEICETGVYHSQFLPGSTGKYRLEYQAILTAAIALQRTLSVGDYLRYEQDRVRFQHEYNAMFVADRLTAILVPGSSTDGASRADLAGVTVLSGSVPGNVTWANWSGAPAICTPAGLSAATGMPFGVQIGMRPWQDTEVLQIAIDYQHAFPYWEQAPPALDSPREIPTAKVVASTSTVADPTGTIATRPAISPIPTLASDPVAF